MGFSECFCSLGPKQWTWNTRYITNYVLLDHAIKGCKVVHKAVITLGLPKSVIHRTINLPRPSVATRHLYHLLGRNLDDAEIRSIMKQFPSPGPKLVDTAARWYFSLIGPTIACIFTHILSRFRISA